METPSAAPTCRTCPPSVESPQILKIQISSLLNQSKREQNFMFEKQNSLSVRLLLPSRSHFLHSSVPQCASFLLFSTKETPSCVSNKTSVPLWKNAFMTTVQRTTQTWAVWALSYHKFFCNFIRLFLPESSWQICFCVTAGFLNKQFRQTVKYNRGFHWSTPDQSGLWAVIDSS